MKKLKRKWGKLLFLIGLFFLLLIVVIIFFIKNKSIKGEDFKVAILANDGVGLVSLSPERKMINVLKLNKESKIWIPGGLGWYRNESIKGLLIQEKQLGKLDDIFFYNFGFKQPFKIAFGCNSFGFPRNIL